MPILPDLDELANRRSSRTKQALDRYDPSTNFVSNKISGYFSILCGMPSIFKTTISNPISYFTKAVHHTQIIHQNFDKTLNFLHPMVFLATNSENDTYNFKEVLQQSDKSEFIKAMMIETHDHENRNHWELYERSKIPKGKRTILSVWSFKRKRYPDGRIKKYKARLCAHGGMQQWGVDYWETYAPEVNWLSVRTLLILSVIHGYHSRSIDFILAFPQAKLDTEVCMEFPAGMNCRDGSRKQMVFERCSCKLVSDVVERIDRT